MSALTLRAIVLFFEPIAHELETREGTVEDQEIIRTFVGERLEFVRDMLAGKDLKRPEWLSTHQ